MPPAGLATVVYIVDADESVRQGLARLLDSAGLRSKSCDSVDAFLRERPGSDIACVLLDVAGVPLQDAKLRTRLRARAAAIPVIALSARDDPATRRMARELGAQAFFRKPVDAAALIDSIDWVTCTGEGNAK